MEKIIYDVLDKFEINNYEAYIVGGYVRDYLMGKETTDIDICTNATPKEIKELFSNFKLTSLEYGNVIFEINNYKFDITTFRKEIEYKDNRKPSKIVYLDSLEEDIKRRDFTVNTICMDKDNNIIDYLDGRKDLKKKILKSVLDADMKLEQDSLRILRAVRFATVLNFKLDNELKKAIIKNKELLRNLSYERKKEELTKIFASENKKYGVKLLKDLGLLEVLELHDIHNVLLTKDITGVWALITDANYPFTKNEKELIKNIRMLMNVDVRDKDILYRYGLYPIGIVCDLKKLNKKKITAMYDKLPIKGKNEIVLTYDEICDLLNKVPGPFLKKIFDDIEEKIYKGLLNNDKEEIKEYILSNFSDII